MGALYVNPIKVLLSRDSKYYNIINDEIFETAFDYANSFDIGNLDRIDNSDLIKYSPFKLVIFDTKKYKSIDFSIKGNAFILINLNYIKYKNINLKNPHNMLFSDDLKTWNNYYDYSNYNSLYVEDYNSYYIRNYIKDNCKYITSINKDYNYILLKLNDEEALNKILESIYIDYKKVDWNVDFTTGSTNQTLITIESHVTELIVKLIKHGGTKGVMDTMEAF